MSSFEPQRFWKYLRLEAFSLRTEALSPFLAPPLLFLVGALFSFLTGKTITDWPTISFTLALLLATTTAAFAHRRELDSGTAAFYMLLPVSQLERFLTRWLLTFVAPFVVQVVLLTVLANAVAGLGALIGRGFGGVIWPDWELLLRYAGFFAAGHSVFFAGGIFFRKAPVIRTIVAHLAYSFFILIALGVGMVMIAFGGHESFTSGAVSLDPQRLMAAFASLGTTGTIAWWVVQPLLLYAASFWRASENEVRA